MKKGALAFTIFLVPAWLVGASPGAGGAAPDAAAAAAPVPITTRPPPPPPPDIKSYSAPKPRQKPKAIRPAHHRHPSAIYLSADHEKRGDEEDVVNAVEPEP